jgi:hypothetical protein
MHLNYVGDHPAENRIPDFAIGLNLNRYWCFTGTAFFFFISKVVYIKNPIKGGTTNYTE